MHGIPFGVESKAGGGVALVQGKCDLVCTAGPPVKPFPPQSQ